MKLITKVLIALFSVIAIIGGTFLYKNIVLDDKKSSLNEVANNNEITNEVNNNEQEVTNVELKNSGENLEKIINIPVDLKKEGLILKSLDNDASYYMADKEKIIEYSIELETLSGEKRKIYFGYASGDDSNKKDYFIQYNEKIVGAYTYVDYYKYIDNWKDAISVIDLNKNDGYMELAIKWKGKYDFIESNEHMSLYRIVNDELLHLGDTMSYELYKKGNKIYDDYCFLRFINEKVEVCHYELINNQIKTVYEFADGRISISNDSRRCRL